MALLTDLYELTMAFAYWKENLHQKTACFQLFFRRQPFKGGFVVTAGLEPLLQYLKNFSFSQSDISYLAGLQSTDGKALFEKDFLKILKELRFTCDLWAMPEGSIVFPYEPILRIEGPLLQCQIFESVALNFINFSSLIATKAARICLAAGEDPVLEFGLRRAQGPDGALSAARSAYIGGVAATSNVLAGKRFNIPVRGTHAHSYVMIFDDEKEAFASYARAMPSNCVFLVDTYNTLEGIEKAIEVGKDLKKRGQKLLGIRLDSGDLAYLSIEARKRLDAEGFLDAKIIVSNELDEDIISNLKQQGACIDIWGVGTNLVTAKSCPALDGVYKLSALQDETGGWQYKVKLSEQMLKISNPGRLQVKRYSMAGEYRADLIFDEDTCTSNFLSSSPRLIDPIDGTRKKFILPSMESEDLLKRMFKQGELIEPLPSLEEIRIKAKDSLSKFHEGIKRLYNPDQFVVGLEESLYDLKIKLIEEARGIVNAKSLING